MDLPTLEAFNETVSPLLYVFGIGAIIAETIYMVRNHAGRDIESRRLGVKCGLLAFGAEGVFYATGMLVLMAWVYEHRLFDLGFGPEVWLLTFVVNDLMFYVSHRLSHRCRILWAIHVVHHSPKHYDLTTGIRGSMLGFASTFPFYAWIPLLGIHPLVALTVDKLFKFYGLAYHTEYVGRLGWFDRVFVSPSNHRVHHATNPQYLDRNYGGAFILFDRLFGTYVPEEEPCTYGLVKDWHSYELWDCQVHEFRDIWRDVRDAPDLPTALGHVFMPPDWRKDPVWKNPGPAAAPGSGASAGPGLVDGSTPAATVGSSQAPDRSQP